MLFSLLWVFLNPKTEFLNKMKTLNLVKFFAVFLMLNVCISWDLNLNASFILNGFSSLTASI